MLRERRVAFSCAERFDTWRLLRNERNTANAIRMPDTTISIVAPASDTCTLNERFKTPRTLIFPAFASSRFSPTYAKVKKRYYFTLSHSKTNP